jgi:hypothetical protein
VVIEQKLLNVGDIEFATLQSGLETLGDFLFPALPNNILFNTLHDFVVFGLFQKEFQTQV